MENQILTVLKLCVSYPAIKNIVLEQMNRVGAEQSVAARSLIIGLFGRKSRTPKILNSSCNRELYSIKFRQQNSNSELSLLTFKGVTINVGRGSKIGQNSIPHLNLESVIVKK